jgi:hypothetical protein
LQCDDTRCRVNRRINCCINRGIYRCVWRCVCRDDFNATSCTRQPDLGVTRARQATPTGRQREPASNKATGAIAQAFPNSTVHTDVDIAGNVPRIANHDEHGTTGLQTGLQTASGTSANVWSAADDNEIETVDERRSHVGPRRFAEIGRLGNHHQTFEGDTYFAGSAQTQRSQADHGQP